jgi:hypothetical protein
MIMSSSPPEANSFRPVNILFSISNIFLFFLTGINAGGSFKLLATSL